MESNTHPTPRPRIHSASRRAVQLLSSTAAMVALSVVLCRFLGYSPQESVFRFDLGFLPIAILGAYYGPIAGAGGYMLADLIGSLLSGYAPNLPILLCNGLFGGVMGLFFYRRRVTLPRTLLCFLAVNLGISTVLMSCALAMYYGTVSPLSLMLPRLANSAVTYPLRVFSFYYLYLALRRPLARLHIGDAGRTRRVGDGSFHRYANSFQAVSVPGLERIRALLALLGDPQRQGRYIHVAGTNGKGSVCAYLTAMLTEAGYRVGRYISPNLIRVNERISVAGEDIPDEELSLLLTRIEPLCQQVEREVGMAPTQFEIWTAAAFCYFQQRKCDYVVLEVGLGGEFDATNVIEHNALAVITRLGMDHMGYLGNTLADIARAKCGILKQQEDAVLVTVEQEPEAMAAVRACAAEKGVRLRVATYTSQGHEDIYERFSTERLSGLTAGISGYCQLENAALATAAAEELHLSEDCIRRGLRAARNPARFERLSVTPPVIYDGGHNENGIRALTAGLERYYGAVPKSVIFACMADKEIDLSLSLLSAGQTRFFFTEVQNNPRTLSAAALAEHAHGLGIPGEAYPNVADAIRTAIACGELTVICGSLYLYQDVMAVFANVIEEWNQKNKKET